jgi:phosphoserine phosphatase
MRYRLVLFDVDSTLINQEVIDLLAAQTPHAEKVASITSRAMAGEIDFDTALQERVSLLEGLPEKVLSDVLNEISFSPGAEHLLTSLRESQYFIGVVSGGFTNVLTNLFADFHLDFLRANTLEIREGRLTGKTSGPVLNRKGKGEALRDFAANCSVALSECVAVGDGSNDLEMIRLAGLGVSYRGKPVLNEAADIVINEPRLDQLLKYL